MDETRIVAAICLVTSVIHLSRAQPPVPDSRDPWLWPFADTSIWNMPIAGDAVYKPANLGAAGHVGADVNHLVKTDSAYPFRQVLDSPTWGPGRCSGAQSLGFALRVPDDWIVPDAGESPYGLTPNSNFAFLLPDDEGVLAGCMVSRCVAGGPVYMPDWMRYHKDPVDLRGSGLDGGGQGASHMSSLGGTIRLGELAGEQPVRHAVKINPWAKKYLHYSTAVPGYRWPATAADSYAATDYNRDADASLVMGSLLAIPPEVTEASLGLQTEPGRKLFFTLKNYGAYFTEDAAWDTWDVIIERDVEKEFEQVHGFSMSSATWKEELNRLMQALSIVDNNGPESIGGGGTPRQPPAPPFSDQVSAAGRIALGHGRHSRALGRQDGARAVALYSLTGRLVRRTVALRDPGTPRQWLAAGSSALPGTAPKGPACGAAFLVAD